MIVRLQLLLGCHTLLAVRHTANDTGTVAQGVSCVSCKPKAMNVDGRASCARFAGKIAMHPKAAMELVRLGAAQALLNMLQDVASPTDRKVNTSL